ncbi:MAG: acyltransferase family protein [Pseudomonadota bacterium]
MHAQNITRNTQNITQNDAQGKITPSYLQEMDGLRAIAVLSVMLFHLDASWLPGGFIGVDIFFVISGYVVCRALHGRGEDGFLCIVTGFYARRFTRIVPALLVCIIATSITTILFIPEAWLSSSFQKISAAALFGISNFFVREAIGDYFSPLIEFNPFAHSWSLGVEEQFYVLFPLLFFLWVTTYRAQASLLRHCGVIVMGGCIVVSFGIAQYWHQSAPDYNYYLLPSRLWELALGALLFQLQIAGFATIRSSRLASLILLVAIAMMGAAMIIVSRDGFPYPWGLLPVFATLFAIIAIANPDANKSYAHRLLRWPVITHIGKASYSLYLWHWPVFVVARWTVGLEDVSMIIPCIGVTFLLGFASLYLVERPMRNIGTGWLRKRPGMLSNTGIVSAGMVAIAVFYFVNDSLYQRRGELTLSVTNDANLWYGSALPFANIATESQEFADRQIFLIGDSHALGYERMMHAFKNQYGVQYHLSSPTVAGWCPILNLLGSLTYSEACEEFVDETIEFVKKQARAGDVVFFASLRVARIGDQMGQRDPHTMLAHMNGQEISARRQQSITEAIMIIQLLADVGVHIIIDQPKPVFPAAAFRCVDWFNKNNPDCVEGLEVSRDFMLNYRAPATRALETIAEQFPNVTIWDPLPILCPGKVCKVHDENGLPLFFDTDHLSGHGNDVLYPEFQDMIFSLWEDVL